MSNEKEFCFFCKSQLAIDDYKMHKQCIDYSIDYWNKNTSFPPLKSKISALKPSGENKNTFFQKEITESLGNHYDTKEYPNLNRKISSYDEVNNCPDLDAGDADFEINVGNRYVDIDRDAGSSIWDASVFHNCCIDRDLYPQLLIDAVSRLNYRRICLVTGPDTWNYIIQLFDDPIKNLCIHSYFITDKCLMDTKSRIYLIDIDDPTIREPWLHGKIRDLM